MTATKVGSLGCHAIQLNSSTLDGTINEVKYVPNLCTNLFSINKAIKNRFKLSNNDSSIYLAKGSASVTFDRVINTLSENIPSYSPDLQNIKGENNVVAGAISCLPETSTSCEDSQESFSVLDECHDYKNYDKHDFHPLS
jgi:hypothetical protein